MSGKPILFSGPMVQAILREIEAPGTGKTQTRRVIKLPTWASENPSDVEIDEFGAPQVIVRETGCFATLPLRYVYGDLLWVRESGSLLREAFDHDPRSGEDVWRDAGFCHAADGAIVQARPYDPPLGDWAGDCAQLSRPSIHMPRWASRLTLEVTGVKVERLQDISEADAASECVESDTDGWFDCQMPATQRCTSARGAFQTLWDAINGPGAWDRNPWVCAITFRPHLCNIDAFLKEKAA